MLKPVKNHIRPAWKKYLLREICAGVSRSWWAISEGRECARKVDEYLMGSSLLEAKDHSLSWVTC
jgi:glutamate synthase (NADPH/NADH) small chain